MKLFCTVAMIAALGVGGCGAGQDAKRVTFDAYITRESNVQAHRVLIDTMIFQAIQRGFDECMQAAGAAESFDTANYVQCITFVKEQRPKLVLAQLVEEGFITAQEMREILDADN